MSGRLLPATHRRQRVADCGLPLGLRQAPAHIDPWRHHDPLRAPRLRTIYYQRHTLDGELPLLEDAPGLGVGEPLPDVPPAASKFTAAEFGGLYRGETGDPTIESAGEQVILLAGSDRVALEPARLPPLLDAFVAGHPVFALFPLRFGRDGAGKVVELIHGGAWYATDAYEGSRVFKTPAAWAAYPGHYRSYNPWGSNFRVVIRKGELLMISPGGAEQTLTPEGDRFRIGDDPLSPEWMAFDTVVDGEALRARLAGGAEHFRFFTP